MNRQDIIAMAIEADLLPENLWETPELEKFASLVAAKEREACAKLSDDMGGIAACSETIRARGQQ